MVEAYLHASIFISITLSTCGFLNSRDEMVLYTNTPGLVLIPCADVPVPFWYAMAWSYPFPLCCVCNTSAYASILCYSQMQRVDRKCKIIIKWFKSVAFNRTRNHFAQKPSKNMLLSDFNMLDKDGKSCKF